MNDRSFMSKAAGTVYLYFRGKDDLLVSLFERTMKDAIAEGRAALAAATILFGALDEMATNWMRSPRQYPLEDDAATVIDLFLNGVGSRPRAVGGAA